MARALIVGAGIAGDTLALHLGRAGWSVTVVEIAPSLRTGGQTVDLRGDSRGVLEDLGLIDAALAHLVPQRGIAWITSAGRRLAAMPVEAFGGKGFVSSEELLRADLARVLHDACGPTVEHRFGDTVTALDDIPGGVRATFRSGTTEDYDLVMGTDGAHSRVRALRFGDESQFRRPLGLAHAWFTLAETDETPSLDGWALVHNAPGRLAVAARPGHPGEQEVGLTFAADAVPRDREAQLALLDATFAGAGWRSDEFLAAARRADDFALDTYDQIHLDCWADGRVLLLGDSAWCASPLSGLGTALGLRGAASLAAALDAAGVGDDPSDSRVAAATTAFTADMRPRVTAAQKLLPGRVEMAAPRTTLGIRANALLMRLIQAPALAPLMAKAAADNGHDVSETVR